MKIKLNENFYYKAFLNYLKKYLPNYTVPKFIRIIKEFSFTATHKIQKINLKSEGFDIHRITDPLFVLLPNSDEYVPLTKDLYQKIIEGKFLF